MEKHWRDVRLSLRSLRRSPTFTVAVIAILALGIGMSTAMFTVFKTVLVDRFPVVAQDRLAIMHPLDQRGTHLDVPYTYLDEIARDSALFRGVAGVQHMGAQAIPFLDAGDPIQLGAVAASSNFFDVVGAQPVVGRFFQPNDSRAGAPPVIVLGYAAWRRRFGGAISVVGRSLVVPYTQQHAQIIGVAPSGLEYPTGTDAWLVIPTGSTTQVDIVARLTPNVTISAARDRLFSLTQRSNPFPAAARGQGQSVGELKIYGVEARSFVETLLGNSKPVIIALTLGIALLMVIACINIATLIVVRLLGRSRDIAVRLALGAGPRDVARLVVTETTILVIVGGVIGCAASLSLLRLVRALAPLQLPRSDSLDALTAPVGVAAALTLAVILVFGALLGFLPGRIGSYAALRSDSRSGTDSPLRRIVRRGLVGTQIALTVVMLTGAGLLVRTLAELQSVDLGYEPSHLTIFSFTAPQSRLPTPERVVEVAKSLLARFEATPGVIAATPIESNPFKGQGFYIMPVTAADKPAAQGEAPFIPFEFVGPNYFRTFEIPIRRGRSFLPTDTRSSSQVAIVNETLAKQLWPNEDPIGKQIKTWNSDVSTVVGVASDTRFRELKNVGPVVYFSWEQVGRPFWNGYLAVRTDRTLGTMLPSLRVAMREANPDLVLWDVQTMDQLLDAPLAQPRLSAMLMASFGLVALLLSALGLYGVMSSAVRQQTRDIGIRVALGATSRDVHRLVLTDALLILGIGALVGTGASFVAGRVLATQLFGVSPVDPVSLGFATGALLVVGLAAAYVPAHHASRIDPLDALRSD